MENEIWKDVPEYEGLYQVSNYGRLLNCKTGRILKGTTNGKYAVFLIGGKNYTRYYAHRLVAILFVQKPNDLDDYDFEELEVDHINGNVFDNRADNLRWCTRKENCNYELHKSNLSKSLKGKTPWNKGVERFLSEETYEKLSQKAKERLKDKTKHPFYNKGTVVLQYSLNGDFIRSWANVSRAAEYYGCTPELIRNCCKEKPFCHTAKGFVWRYKEKEAV